MTKHNFENSTVNAHPDTRRGPMRQPLNRDKTGRTGSSSQHQSSDCPAIEQGEPMCPNGDNCNCEISMSRDPAEPESTESAHAGGSDAIMTPQEAAEYLRISIATLLRGSRLGEIPGFQVGKKLWRYRKFLLDEWAHSKVSSFRHPCRK